MLRFNIEDIVLHIYYTRSRCIKMLHSFLKSLVDLHVRYGFILTKPIHSHQIDTREALQSRINNVLPQVVPTSPYPTL